MTTRRTACTRPTPERDSPPLTAAERTVWLTLTPEEQVHMVVTEMFGSPSEALAARRVLAPRHHDTL